MNEMELLQSIEESGKNGADALDLSGQNLVELPPEITQLTSLESLDLRNNQLTVTAA
ncbi:MAG: hypothetical protein WKF28_00405 [Rubrobacteraceae bacterium]